MEKEIEPATEIYKENIFCYTQLFSGRECFMTQELTISNVKYKDHDFFMRHSKWTGPKRSLNSMTYGIMYNVFHSW